MRLLVAAVLLCGCAHVRTGGVEVRTLCRARVVATDGVARVETVTGTCAEAIGGAVAALFAWLAL